MLRHVIGQDQSDDELLIEEEKRDRYLSLNKTRDDCYVIISSNSKTASEVPFATGNVAVGSKQIP